MFLGEALNNEGRSSKYLSAVNDSNFMQALKLVNSGLHESLKKDIIEAAQLLRPEKIRIIDGTEKEDLIQEMLRSGILIELNQNKYPGSYLHRSNINDVARSEKDTYICTSGDSGDAGPTNNWMKSSEAIGILRGILDGSMAGKTMYVVPYWLGPLDSPFGDSGVEITNNPYVVLNLMIITKTGKQIVESFASKKGYVLGVHSTCNLDSEKRFICHFPEMNDGRGLIISVNTDYGGNALLSKKCHALRIASRRAKVEGWMAEHMMLIGVTEPGGLRKTFITGAFPSSSGKTNLSMIEPVRELKEQGWSSELISDDITWINLADGVPRGINPESGFFGVLPHTSYRTNPNAMRTIQKNTIFTNAAIDGERNPFWEGMEDSVPADLTDWTGKKYTGKDKAAHPNSRFTTSIEQYPHLSEGYSNPEGVPISAFLYGGRRRDLMPLVFETYSWDEGVLIGAMQRVETTAASTGKVGVLRSDPMAMRPFTGYNMADYFSHHLQMGDRMKVKPRIYNVNWFRKGDDGSFLWPGYSYNMYVLRWIVRRVHSEGRGRDTPIGIVPEISEFSDITGVDRKVLSLLLDVDSRAFLKEFEETETFFKSFGDRFPERLWKALNTVKERLNSY